MRTVEIWVPGRLPGLNDFIYVKHHFQRSALKREGGDRVALVALANRVAPFVKPIHCTVLCYETNRRRDKDNIIGGALKCVLDGLGPKGAGLLSGDGWRDVAGVAGECFVDKESPGVRAILREVDE